MAEIIVAASRHGGDRHVAWTSTSRAGSINDYGSTEGCGC
jgi:hypothetical protein